MRIPVRGLHPYDRAAHAKLQTADGPEENRDVVE